MSIHDLSDLLSRRWQQRRTMDDAMFPDWTARAKCAAIKVRSGTGGHWYDDAYTDEVAHGVGEREEWPDQMRARQERKGAEWPARTVNTMRLCASCPVRRECLEYAMTYETRFSQRWKQGELVEQDRRFGVYGGVPGRIRERFGTMPCPVCGGSGVEPGGFNQPPLGMKVSNWNAEVWTTLGPLVTKKSDGTPLTGWPCTNCKRSGRVPRPDRIEACIRWFQDYCKTRRWSVESRQEGAA